MSITKRKKNSPYYQFRIKYEIKLGIRNFIVRIGTKIIQKYKRKTKFYS